MSTRTAAQVGERALLAAIRELLDGPEPPEGPGDDAALIRELGDALLTVDSVVAGQDWLPESTPPDAIGHRAAAVNLSDLAAMGARPRALLLALELDRDDDVDDALEGVAALAALARQHGAAVVGGDIGIGTGPQRWTVTAVGERRGHVLRRDNATVGQRVWLVGEVGRAALGLHALLHGRRDTALRGPISAHLRPSPLIAAGQALAGAPEALAAIDVSDGLWLDAARLAEASAVGLRIEVPRPDWVSPELTHLCRELDFDWREGCATGGDDYALLVTAPWGLDLRALIHAADPGRPVVAIGEVVAGAEVTLDVGSRRLVGTPRGWWHGDA